jgi:NhaA family Na+:H+ antiporter
VNSRKPSIERILQPFEEFVHLEASGGVLLLLFTVLALIWANSPWSSAYTSLWQTQLVVGLGDFSLAKPLLLWINDGLMAIFFLVVGLEIKRELLVGGLASLQQAALPIAAAAGGMVLPAIIYVAWNIGKPDVTGWGIPMATDIAFALGIFALLGKRGNPSLKLFLTALAIVDDIGAVLVIALFHTANIAWIGLVVAALFMGLLILSNWIGIRHPLVYAVLGIGLWFAFLKSGIHATVAGVLLAMTIPARTRIDTEKFLERSRTILHEFEDTCRLGREPLADQGRHAALQALETACQHAETPLQRLEHVLHPWVAFGIMPLFALANAGVCLTAEVASCLTNPVALGIIAGLVLGKPIGVTLFTWLSVRSGITTLPSGVTWRQIVGTGCLAGIGFTMSLFIAGLAFGGSPLLDVAKIGIMVGSPVVGMIGWIALRFGSRNKEGETMEASMRLGRIR